MSFSLPEHWVWDFWFADDGTNFHMYYLHAPKSLINPDLRHRNAVIGHATSQDLTNWTDRGPVLTPGGEGDFDETATWTGCVVLGPDGVWRMFYTGSRFLSPDSNTNIETIGVAKSADLHNWVKMRGPIVEADPRWYEKLGDSSWPEEAWRDPWVFSNDEGDLWHMLITARANTGDELDRGVVAHATSTDFENWTVQPPLSKTGSGFRHLEVPQIAVLEESNVLLFSCDQKALAGARSNGNGGIWALRASNPAGPYDASEATLVSDETLYSGRLIRNRRGEWVMLAFTNKATDGTFQGTLTDPMRVTFDRDSGGLSVEEIALA